MAAKNPVTLGPMRFEKKGDAVAYLKAMLHRYDVGDRVSAADCVVLEAALARHPEAKAKIGVGVADFSVRSADFGTKCFWVNRTDGTTMKFSHTACVWNT
jgi:hypothetical protein